MRTMTKVIWVAPDTHEFLRTTSVKRKQTIDAFINDLLLQGKKMGFNFNKQS